MADVVSAEDVRRIVGDGITLDEAGVLADWYANLARGVANFPFQEIKAIEPPLRSTPGPER